MQFYKSLLKHPYSKVILLGIILRIIWSIAVPVIPISDGNAYNTFAQNLANGDGYAWGQGDLTSYWAPGAAFIYGAFYFIFGQNYLPIIIFHIIISAVTIWATMSLAESWFNYRTAIVSGLILALWPAQIQFTTVLASELIFSAFVIVALLLWQNESQFTLKVRCIGVGILLGCACYVRPLALLIPFMLLFLRVLKTKEIFNTVVATIVMFLIMALIIAPWSYRNTQLYGKFTLISTNSGPNLWMGNNPKSQGTYMKLPPEVKGMNEYERNDYLKTLAKDYVKEKPFVFIKGFFVKLIKTHNRESIGIIWNEKGLISRYGKGIITPLKLISFVYWLSALLLGLVGIVMLLIKQGWWNMVSHPTVLFWSYYAGVHAVVVAQDRYHFPSVCFIAVLAAFALSQIWFKNDRQLKTFS